MSTVGGPSRTRGRRRLLRQLMKLRMDAGFPLDEAAAVLGKSGSALYRMEAGQVAKIRPIEVRELCAAYGAPRALAEELTKLAADTARAPKGWWDAIGGSAAPWFTTLLSLEDEASRIDAWHPLLVPGLFQTEDYARAVMVASVTLTDATEIERQVSIRMARQDILDRTPTVEVWAVLDESVLHRQIGSTEVMRAQLQHLVSAAERSNVTIQVVPFSAGGHPALSGGPIVLFSFADPTDPGVVYLDNHAGSLHLEEPPEVAAYGRLIEHVRSSASSTAVSRDMIAKRAAAL